MTTANECRHIKADGSKCRAAAIHQTDWCWFHSDRQRIATPGQPDSAAEATAEAILPPRLIEDRASIQLALSDLYNALAANKISPRRASTMTYILQCASRNCKNSDDITSPRATAEVTLTNEGHLAGPLKPCPPPPCECCAHIRCNWNCDCGCHHPAPPHFDPDSEADLRSDSPREAPSQAANAPEARSPEWQIPAPPPKPHPAARNILEDIREQLELHKHAPKSQRSDLNIHQTRVSRPSWYFPVEVGA